MVQRAGRCIPHQEQDLPGASNPPLLFLIDLQRQVQLVDRFVDVLNGIRTVPLKIVRGLILQFALDCLKLLNRLVDYRVLLRSRPLRSR